MFTINDSVYVSWFEHYFRYYWTYIIPFGICLLNFLSPYLPIPIAAVGSRPEFFIPVSLFCSSTVLYGASKNIKLSKSSRLLIFAILIFALFCGKRVVTLSASIPLIILIFIQVFSQNYLLLRIKKNIFPLILISLLTLGFSFKIFADKTFKDINSPKGYGVSREYSSLIDKSSFSTFASILDSSTSERIAKSIKSFNILQNQGLSLALPKGINSFKTQYGFLPDSGLQAIAELGLIVFLSVLIIYFGSIISIIQLFKYFGVFAQVFILSPFVAFTFCIASVNIITMITIIPFLALYTSLVRSRSFI